MLIKDYILQLFLFMLGINFILFIFLLIRKMYMKILTNKKEYLEKKYEEQILSYISNHDKSIIIIPRTKLEIGVFRNLLLNYSSLLTGETKELLNDFAAKDSLIADIRKKLLSNNPWKKRIGAYQAGEFGFDEFSEILLKQLKTSDKELFYITSRALIKLGGKLYIKQVLYQAVKEAKMEKNNILTLVELVEEDINDILDQAMAEDNAFLNAIALEIYGQRQYMEAVFWIDKMISSPYKEVRIASLKAAEALGDIGDNEYINKILSLEFDQEWEVRAFLAKFLKKVKTDNSVEGLKRLMKDMNWFVRYNAANSLAEQGEKGIKALIDLLNSEDKFARDKAKEMIQKEIVFHKLFNDLEGSLKNKILSQIKLDGIEGGINSGI
jgi:HEAT repeat protein